MEQIEQSLALYLVPVSIFVGAVVAIATYAWNRWAHRRALTVQLVSIMSTTAILDEANWCSICLMRDNTKTSIAQLTKDEEKCLIRLLNFYEFLCTSLKDGVLDEPTVRHLRGGAMAQLYRFTAAMLNEWRDLAGRRDLYREFETYAVDFNKRIATP